MEHGCRGRDPTESTELRDPADGGCLSCHPTLSLCDPIDRPFGIFRVDPPCQLELAGRVDKAFLFESSAIRSTELRISNCVTSSSVDGVEAIAAAATLVDGIDPDIARAALGMCLAALPDHHADPLGLARRGWVQAAG